MSEEKTKPFDLEERTFIFARNCRDLVKKFSINLHNLEYGKQLVRSASSVAANYIEANESLSRKDYFHRVKICRKESKESLLWLKLADISQEMLKDQAKKLKVECGELMRIFGSILEKNK